MSAKPASTYECLIMLDANKVSGDTEGAKNQLHALLEKHHCEILQSTLWEEKRLAYPIRQHKKGIYFLIYYKSDSQNLQPLEEDFRLNEMVVRTLTLKIHPKWLEPLMKASREEKGGAIRIAGDDSLDGGGPGGFGGPRGGGEYRDRDRDREERRPPRRAPAGASEE
jgi:small subunit ribosomal protein S6